MKYEFIAVAIAYDLTRSTSSNEIVRVSRFAFRDNQLFFKFLFIVIGWPLLK